MAEGVRKRLLQRHAGLKQDRSEWDTHCSEITDYLLPYAGRYNLSETNRGAKRNSKIIDSSATRYARGLSAGMMSYNNSQARPWFALTLAEVELSRFHPVKLWLKDVTERMHRVLHAGNTYRVFHKMYDEMIAFGTAVSIMQPDFEHVLWHHPVTNGQFVLADNSRGEIDVCYREFQMTVAQMVEQFGVENCSDPVREAWSKQEGLDRRFTVIHAIEPRKDRNPMRRDGRNKKYQSIYFEAAARDDQLLSEDGFDQFPVIAPRWDTTGGDVYGNGPGMECLGHIKQLQLMAEQEAKAIEYGVEPPLQGPSGLKDKDVDRLPGGFTAVDLANPASKVQEMWRVSLDINHLLLSKNDVRQQIRESFYADLFQAFVGLDSTQRTAEEIKARGEEKMLLLGPVTAAIQREMHGPVLDMLFQEMLKGGALPPPPEELSGVMLNIEYVSVLAQAQKAIGANGMDRFMFAVGQLYPIKPDVLDKVDTDRWVEHYADRLGIDPDEIVPSEQVALIRQKRNEANAAKEQALLMEQQAKTAQALGSTPVGGAQPSALDALGQLTGYGPA